MDRNGLRPETRTDEPLSRLISAAVVNRRFRGLLLDNPKQAIHNGYCGESFNLSPDQERVILSIHADSWPDFANKLAEKLETMRCSMSQNGTKQVNLSFSNWLKNLMTERNLGPTELGRRAEVSHASIISWLQGNTARAESVIKIANALGVSPVVALHISGHDMGLDTTDDLQNQRIRHLINQLPPYERDLLETIARELYRRANSKMMVPESAG